MIPPIAGQGKPLMLGPAATQARGAVRGSVVAVAGTSRLRANNPPVAAAVLRRGVIPNDRADQNPDEAARPALGEMPSCDARGSGDQPVGCVPATGIFIVKVPEPSAGSRRLLASRQCFVWRAGDDTKLRRDETVFRMGEDIRKPALDTNRPRNVGPQRSVTGDRHDQSSFSCRT
jgi:hypothetical protein